MPVVSLRHLLESGVHLGHQDGPANEKMKRFILADSNGINVIDLERTLPHIDRAYKFVKDAVAQGGTVLFVGTKKQAQQSIEDQATRVGQPYVNHRWLEGMLTNFQTVAKRIQRMKELEEIDFDDVDGSTYTKKELLLLKRELIRLETNFGGIRNLTKAPSVLWVVDPREEHLAVDEAKKLNIPVVAILGTNCDPYEVHFPIPGNDDAVDSIDLLTRVIADAVGEGLIARNQPAEEEEPMADWERALRGDHPRLAPVLTASRDIPPDIQSRPRNRLLLGATTMYYHSLLPFLSEELGIKFRNHSKDEWVIGARVLVNDDDDSVLIRAVHDWVSTGVQIELLWTGHTPPITLMQQYAREIPIMLHDFEYEYHRANGGTLATFREKQVRTQWRMA